MIGDTNFYCLKTENGFVSGSVENIHFVRKTSQALCWRKDVAEKIAQKFTAGGVPTTVVPRYSAKEITEATLNALTKARKTA